MSFGTPFRDCKTKASASGFTRTAFVNAVKPVEDFVSVLGRNAGATILYFDAGGKRISSQDANCDLSVARRILDCIVHQVDYDLAQDDAVGSDLNGIVSLQRQRLAFFFCEYFEKKRSVPDQREKAVRSLFQPDLAGIRTGDCQETLNKAA
jgi:hypothetical protein